MLPKRLECVVVVMGGLDSEGSLYSTFLPGRVFLVLFGHDWGYSVLWCWALCNYTKPTSDAYLLPPVLQPVCVPTLGVKRFPPQLKFKLAYFPPDRGSLVVLLRGAEGLARADALCSVPQG